MALITELAAQFNFDAVSLGLLDGEALRIVGRSHGLEIIEGTEANAMLTAVMNEAVEQQVTLAVPLAGQGQHWVTLSHEALQRRDGGAVATIPLAAEGKTLGAVTFQRNGSAVIGADELAELEHMLGLVAPTLHLMRRNERSTWRWLKDGVHARIRRLRAIDARWLRAGLGILTAVVLVLLLVPVTQRVTAPARVEGQVQRVIVAPTDSYIRIALVRPGDAVKAGQVLAELMDQDLMLERDRLASQLAQHETGYATAMSRADRAEAAVHLAQQSEAQAELDLVEREITRASIVAPFDGIIIQGDLSQSAGAPVRQGDTLFTIAPAGHYRVMIEVDERDIAAIREGQRGSLALSALPWDTLNFRITRITPLATTRGKHNVFEVEAELPHPPAGLRPGLRGNARIGTGRQQLAISWGAAIGARIRQMLWTWLP